jgi:uncharacterized membrane protein
MMGRYGYGYSTGGGVVATLVAACIGALILAGLIILLIYLVRAAGTRGTGHHPHAAPGQRGPDTGQGTGFDFLGPRGESKDEAVEIARRRFAAGEITKEQLDEIVAALNR